MPFNGSGSFGPIPPPDYPAVAGTVIRAGQFNANMQDIFGGLNNCLTRDGQGRPTANIDWAGYNLSNVKDLSATEDLTVGLNATIGQDAAIGRDLSVTRDLSIIRNTTLGGTLAVTGVATVPTPAVGDSSTKAATTAFVIKASQNASEKLLGTVAGTNTITAVATPTLAAYVAGQTFTFYPANANTGAVTLNIDGLGAIPVVWPNGAVLVGTEIAVSTPLTVLYDGTSFRAVYGLYTPLIYSGWSINSYITLGASGGFANFYDFIFRHPVRLKTAVTGVTISNLAHFNIYSSGGGLSAVTSSAIKNSTLQQVTLEFSTAAGPGVVGAWLEAMSTAASIVFTGHTF